MDGATERSGYHGTPLEPRHARRIARRTRMISHAKNREIKQTEQGMVRAYQGSRSPEQGAAGFVLFAGVELPLLGPIKRDFDAHHRLERETCRLRSIQNRGLQVRRQEGRSDQPPGVRRRYSFRGRDHG